MGAFDPKGAVIVAVEPGGMAEEAGLRPGDRVLTLNGQAPIDLMDLLEKAADGPTRWEIARDDQTLQFKLPRLEHEALGAEFNDTLFNRVKTCRNKCVFCFMDQMPKKMRGSLYYRDDDYRLSNLHGNFITLTNMSDEEWQRIEQQHVSPLYISVHATDEDLREELLGATRQARMPIMDKLRQLVEWGIELHTQIVLMPGLNDGAQLDKSIQDLATLLPSLRTISIVPVGLTRYRAHLPFLKPVTPEMVPELIRQVERYQREFLRTEGDRIVYLADEMYLIGGLPMPPHHYYGDYPQHENGVGMVRKFMVDFNRRKRFLPAQLPHNRWLMVTGEYGGQIFPPLIRDLEGRHQDLEIRLAPVRNVFFGDLVRCAGLLTGRDVLRYLEDHREYLAGGARVMMPGNALKDAAVVGASEAGMLLDDISLQGLADHFGATFVNAGSTCEDWLHTLRTGLGEQVFAPRLDAPTPIHIQQFPEHQAKAS